MPSVVIQKFGGLVPRLSARLLAAGSATVALMVRLWYGELRPFRQLQPVTLPPGQGLPTDGLVRTIYKLADKWLAWVQDVDVVSGFTTLAAAGHIYFTGDGAPKQSAYSFLVGGPSTPDPSTVFPLGVVGPTVAPTVSIVGVGTGDPIVRSYVYTFYTRFNEESVPSPPSALISVETGQSVDLSGFEIPIPPTTVERIRIYRTVGGEYLFVTEFYTAAYSPPVNDALLDTDLAEPLISQHFYPPPADLRGLIGLACGSLAAFHGNKVMFSEPYQPGAWPPEYEKVFDYNVVALGTFGQTCIVATSGYTYLVSGSDPRSFSVARVPDPYPCISKKSMASVDNGCLYASDSGLIFIGNANSNSTGVYVLTRQLMTREDWSRYALGIIGAFFDGRYYGFYLKHTGTPFDPGAGFVYDFSNHAEALVTGVSINDSEDKTDLLVDIDLYATAVFASPQVPLHLSIPVVPATGPTYNNQLFVWDRGADYDRYVWRSKQFSFPYAISFSAAKIIFNDQYPIDTEFKFRIYDAFYILRYERTVTSSAPFRLPSLKPRTEWLFEVEGSSFVQMIEVSSSYQDLMERKTS